jgi:carbamoyltransferase
MSQIQSQTGAKFTWLPKLIEKLSTTFFTWLGQRQKLFRVNSKHYQQVARSFQEKLLRGDTVYVVGIGPAGHNSGVALIAVSKVEGIQLLANHEEERFTGKKHCAEYPEKSLEILKQQLASYGLSIDDIHCVVASWDYIGMIGLSMRTIFEHAPASFALFKESAEPNFNIRHIKQAFYAPRKLRKQFHLPQRLPIIGMPHHDNHAYFAYATSPFIYDSKPVMVTVIDGTGDRGAISLYVAQNHQLKSIYQNQSIYDSLGVLYGYISATQGGWSFLSSEGRYMGAAAWGDINRLTNRYYKRLRQLLYFGANGEVKLNRQMSRWHVTGQNTPYKQALIDILGEPIPPENMWNPDAILSVDNIQHSSITQERVDKAAALQLVFEDALFHIIDHLIKVTGSDRLVMSGGTALNCVANMRLLEHFNQTYYQRYLNKKTHLHIWVPPTPGDAGVVMGAAYTFAMQNAGKAKQPLLSPFVCGLAPSKQEIEHALQARSDLQFKCIGNIATHESLLAVADFMAAAVSRNFVIGIYQGRAETGPRALGHRSILANPCHTNTLELLNARVKLREKIRPLAPMVTLEAAKKLYHLAPGAATNDYHAYDYMVLTVQANALAREKIPAVVHEDGTSRIQIVREANNPLIYHYLQAMQKHVGVAVSVNTSLNVGSPIVQTPQQAIEVLFRAKAMDGLIMVSQQGEVYLACPIKANTKSTSHLWPFYTQEYKYAMTASEV